MSVKIGVDGTASVTFDDGVVFSFKSRMMPADTRKNEWHFYDTKGRVLPNYMVNASRFHSTIIKLRFEIEDLWMALRDYPALEYMDFDGDEFGDPVSTGSITAVDLFGNVSHIVDSNKRVLVNKTMQGHVLDQGYVIRHVWAEGRRNYIQSVGFGTGAMARVNELGANLVWGQVSLRSIRNMATRYYQQRTGKSAALFEHEAGYDEVPLIVEENRRADSGEVTSNPHVPVGTVSSARRPGVFGSIEIGTETNALDVISDENYMLNASGAR